MCDSSSSSSSRRQWQRAQQRKDLPQQGHIVMTPQRLVILPLRQMPQRRLKQTAAWQLLLAVSTEVQPRRRQDMTMFSSNSLSMRRRCFRHWCCAQMPMQQMSTACSGILQTMLYWRQQATIMTSSCGNYVHECMCESQIVTSIGNAVGTCSACLTRFGVRSGVEKVMRTEALAQLQRELHSPGLCKKAEQHCAAAHILWQVVDTTTSQMHQDASVRTSTELQTKRWCHFDNTQQIILMIEII